MLIAARSLVVVFLLPPIIPMTLCAKCSMHSEKLVKMCKRDGKTKVESTSWAWVATCPKTHTFVCMVTEVKKVNKKKRSRREERDAWPGNVPMTTQAEGQEGIEKTKKKKELYSTVVGLEGEPDLKKSKKI